MATRGNAGRGDSSGNGTGNRNTSDQPKKRSK